LAIGLAVFTAIGLLLVFLRLWPMINVVETGRTPEYPDVVPRAYQATRGQVFDAALHAVNQMPRWSLVSYREDGGEIRAEARTFMLRFVDDVVIHVIADGKTAVVDVRSASRLGRGDFGQNARNIRAFFKQLDRQMGERSIHESGT
jgi:uncharacterized protein (DUF1499 family)